MESKWSTFRIEDYVKFIITEPSHQDIAGQALADVLKIVPEGSEMENTYKTLDGHLSLGKYINEVGLIKI